MSLDGSARVPDEDARPVVATANDLPRNLARPRGTRRATLTTVVALAAAPLVLLDVALLIWAASL